jgi:hypothetical protein
MSPETGYARSVAERSGAVSSASLDHGALVTDCTAALVPRSHHGRHGLARGRAGATIHRVSAAHEGSPSRDQVPRPFLRSHRSLGGDGSLSTQPSVRGTGELHERRPGSSEMLMDLEVKTTCGRGSKSVCRGPSVTAVWERIGRSAARSAAVRTSPPRWADQPCGAWRLLRTSRDWPMKTMATAR